ncbi:sensor histidine kinase [Paenibacillus sp. IB182496]|uniref:Sensor histidine kinase n=1 Tax=Paenibacillus sabuli TaxID=2772509 RepID=A0A927BW40_9BACL|nr:sensor histidine kinase [Paenibacillus sabuli]MBD2846549.1 sensor histidine kinase [Paenibacillus sabuli]
MNRLLHNIRLRNKMLLVYFGCIFAPMLVTNMLFYTIIADNVRERRVEEIDRAVEQIRNDFRAQIDGAVGVSAFFYADSTTNELLERDYARTEAYVEAYDGYLRRIFGNHSMSSPALQSITVYVDNPTILHSGNIGLLSAQVKRTAWYAEGSSSERSYPVFVRTTTEDGRFGGFSLLRRMDYFQDRMSKEKLLRIDFKTLDLIETFANLNMTGDLYLVNPQGGIEYTTDAAVDWRGQAAYAALQADDAMEFVKDFGGVSYLKGWRIVGAIDEDEIIREVRRSRDFIVWSACLMILLPTVIILLVTRSMNVRIVRILQHMKKVKNQQFARIAGDQYRDEIGQLTLEFNRMILQIRSLIDDVYLADIQRKSLELARRKAQWNALQSQINPHFLFNALETIRMRSLLKQEKETAKIIHSMARMFRSSLTWNKDRISVKEELELIECFLDIQRYRFEDKLSCRIEVAPEAYDCEVPKMLLLPFAENACIHGIEPLKQGGEIHIRITTEEDELRFEVTDNGRGMEEEEVKRIYTHLNADDMMGERIGLQNVIYRARMAYGDRFRLSVNSRPDVGTAIVLRMPLRSE